MQIQSNGWFLLGAGAVALTLVLPRSAEGLVGRKESERAREELSKQALSVTRVRQGRVTASKFYSQVGRKLYEAFQFERAQGVLEQAIELDPNNREAQRHLRLTREVLGTRMDKVRTTTEHLAGEKKVKIQEQIIELENNYYRGRQLYNEAIHPAEPAESLDVRYARSIRNLDFAISRFQRAREIIRWMPHQVDLSDHEQRVNRFLVLARKYRRDREVLLQEHRREISRREIKRRRQDMLDFERRRMSRLIDRASMLLEKREYESAEKLTVEILQIDPNNFQAQQIYDSARRRMEVEPPLELAEIRREEKLRLQQRLLSASIPHAKYLVYPENWDEISKRPITQRLRAAEPQWKKDIRKQMDKKVTFEFVETPLVEAIRFLQTLAEVTIILDPKAFETGGDPTMPITLRVTDMRLERALKWILRLADLEFSLKGEAIFISTPQNLAGDVELRIYDIRDLTLTVTNFPGPEIMVRTLGRGSGSSGAGIGQSISLSERPEEIFEAGSLADLIRTRIKPDRWSVELGTSIEEREGKLVVMQRPEIHMLIEKLLKSFRDSQTLQVVVQARFIEVVDSFLEDIGIEWLDMPQAGYSAPGFGPVFGGNSGTGTSGYIRPTETWLPYVPNQGVQQGGGGQQTVTVPLVGGQALPGQGIFSAAPPFLTSGFAFRREHSGNFWNNNQPGMNQPGILDYRLRSRNLNYPITPFRSRLGPNYATGRGQGALFQFAFVGNIQAQAILHAVKQDEHADLLLAPRLTMYNNQRAYILAARQQAYIADYDISGGVFDPVIQTILEGIVLDVKPTVSHDRRYITLELRPGTAQRLDLSRTETIGGIVSLPIQLPKIELRSVRCTVTLPDGGTLLISGLMSHHKFDAHSGIPFLSDLPIVGRLFGSDLKQRERQNLIILVTANLILFDEEEERL